MRGDYPEFEMAERRFRDFLSSQGLPTIVAWTSSESVVVIGKRFVVRDLSGDVAAAQARREYEAAIDRRIGVVFEAICSVAGRTYARVRVPSSHADAQQRLIADGLKLSTPNPLRPGRLVASRVSWWWYRHRGKLLSEWDQEWAA